MSINERLKTIIEEQYNGNKKSLFYGDRSNTYCH